MPEGGITRRAGNHRAGRWKPGARNLCVLVLGDSTPYGRAREAFRGTPGIRRRSNGEGSGTPPLLLPRCDSSRSYNAGTVIHHHKADTSSGAHPGTIASVLPEYAKPPVVEVAISVQFEELAGFSAVHFGLLWEKLRSRYPDTEHHPPLASVVELFGSRGAKHASLSIESQFPIGRCWYLSADKLRLIQVQPDRFVLNWRKLDTDTKYPRYENLREAFQSELALFLEFVTKHGLGGFEPTQCELTYVNHLVAGQGWQDLRDLPNVIALWSGRASEPYLPDIEDAGLVWQYRFEENSVPVGRLNVQLQSAFRNSDSARLLNLQLLGRGAPLGSGLDGVLAFTDRAHEWIVRGFTAITTEHMHRIWERIR